MWPWANHLCFWFCLGSGGSRIFLPHRQYVSMSCSDTVVVGAVEMCKAGRCVTAPSQKQLQQRIAYPGFPQSCINAFSVLSLFSFQYNSFTTFFKINNRCTKSLGVCLESSCSMKDEAMWGCKRTGFSLSSDKSVRASLSPSPHPNWFLLLQLKSVGEKHWYGGILREKSADKGHPNNTARKIKNKQTKKQLHKKQKLSLLPKKIIQW